MNITIAKILNKKKFRVKYKDDRVSKLMTYKLAKEYAAIFAGKVIYGDWNYAPENEI